MDQSPMFNIFRHAFLVLGNSNEGEAAGNFDNAPIEMYGDTLVNDLFELNINDIETEASLVTNVWMAAVHQLFQMLRECKASEQANGLAALDKAAALWIGEGQEEGSNEIGNLLYNLAENAGERFDQDNGETFVNTQIMELLVTMQTNLNAGVCSSEEGYRELRATVKQTIGLMTVPLVQNLIHHIMNLQNEGGSNFVELYALATMPRVAACDPAAYDEELHLEVLRELQSSQAEAAIQAVQKVYSCLGITCSQVGSYLGGTVPECQNETMVMVAGYTTAREGARQKIYLERDIKAIDIFLKFEAYEAAKDWYENGWNSEVFRLKDLAGNKLIPTASESSYISIFQKYYSDDNFADNLMISIFDLVTPYNNADKEQVRKIATGVLKYVVIFMTSAASLQYATEQCDSNQGTALEYWDTGSLFYIGSMEGEASSGNEYGGEFMFSTAKELCTEFGTCVIEAADNSGVAVAAANEVLVEALKQGLNSIAEGSCDVAKGILENQILPTMIIPMIQGTIRYASNNALLQPGTTDSSLAIGDTFARGIAPILGQSNHESASVIMENMRFQLLSQPVPGGFTAVANALRDALENTTISCADVGEYEGEPLEGKMCRNEDGDSNQQPVSSDGIVSSDGVAFGRYTFQDLDVVDVYGSLALDVRDMFQASSLDEAQKTYNNGTNARSGSAGNISTISLASLSHNAAKHMNEDPMFNIYRYALYDDEDLEDNSGEDFLYADNVVTEALTNGKDSKLAAEAAVVMNAWMVIVHKLYRATRFCVDQEDPVPSIDAAVALWIGKEQKEAKFDQGWMLYSVAQSAAQFYGLEEGEAAINTELMNLFNEVQASGKTCLQSEKAAMEMHFQVNELVKTLSKPLILTLLYHLVSGSRNMLELYAVSVIPQAMACNEKTGEFLQDVLFNNYTQDAISDELLEHLVTFLRCQRISAEDLSHSKSADPSFRKLLNSLLEKIGHRGFIIPHLALAGYDGTTDTSEMARLDMDILEIKIMMRAKAFKAARDIYEHGHNAYDETKEARFLSLQSFAKRHSFLTPMPQALVDEYYDTKFFANEIISMAFSRTGDLVDATREQLAEVVTRTLQTMVTYDATLELMNIAGSSCSSAKSSTEENEKAMTIAAKHWDEAVALYVGSIEGSLAGGRQGGFFMYALANEVCSQFDVCEASGESSINQDILIQFAAGRDAIKDNNCDTIQRILTTKILPSLLIVLIQGTLSALIENQVSVASNATSFATAYIMSKTVVPFVNLSNSTSSATIEKSFGDFSAMSSNQPIEQIIEAFAYSLRGMGIDCSDIGTPTEWPDLSLCLGDGDLDGEDAKGNVPDQLPVAETPTNLGDGLYVTTTYVQDRASIAKDILDLKSALESDSYSMAQLIYKDGKNSKSFDENGKFESLRSLKSFSVEQTLDMLDEPLFNFFIYSLQSSDGTFMSRDVRLYADSIVQDAFKNVNSTSKTLPVEATLALNLWMYVAHLLYKTLKDCKKKVIVDDDGIHSIDIAVAYWIGDGQISGSSDNGHLLYALAERMDELFSQDKTRQSRTNTNILQLFNKAKHKISLPGACSDNPSSYLHLSRIVNKITSLMAVPLIQSLIHNLRNDDRARVKLYAHSVIPLMAGCSPDGFKYLEEKLLNMTYKVAEIDDIIFNIRNSYPCLGLSCSDIGIHTSESNDAKLQCQDPDELSLFAGYKAKYQVNDFAKLDLDVRELDILLSMKAYDAADNLYTYGKHSNSISDGSLSLFHLATTQDREMVPSYDAFVRYYRNQYDDPSLYADHIIRAALANTGDKQWNDAQRRIIVLKSAQVLIMYFSALQPLYEAAANCGSSEDRMLDDFGDLWDQGAAFMIGSIEGTKTNGTHDGYMLYDLAQEYCKEFGTCLPDKTGVVVNDRLISLLYTGRGALLSNSCGTVRKAVNGISSLLLIPMIQGALSSALKISKSRGAEADVHRAEAYVYSRALLPLVAAVDWGASQKIDTFLGFPGPSSTRQTVSEVFLAFAKVYPGMNVDCEMIGTIDGNDPCHGVVYEQGMNQLLWIILGSVLGFCVLCTCVFYLRSRKETRRLPENNPRFIIPETGELNHSMDLLEKAFSSTSSPRITTNATEMAALTEDMYTDASSGGDDDSEDEQTNDLEVI